VVAVDVLFDIDEETLVVGKEYLPAVPLLIICEDGCNELSRIGGRGRRSDSGGRTGTVLPKKFSRLKKNNLMSKYQTW
jgi:hypothetical protein